MTRPTLANALAERPNDHARIRDAFEARTGHPWHRPTPAGLAAGRQVSVVIPARDTAYCLQAVLDALRPQAAGGNVQVVLVDDASVDATAAIAGSHPAVDTLIRLPAPVGSAAARNTGTLLAEADTVLYLDSDIVLPPHAVADIAARADEATILLGFRHNMPFPGGASGPLRPPAFPADLAADHRVTWRSNGGKQLYTGVVLDGPTVGNPLEDTRDFADLGYGARYLDWDLPRTVVTAVLGVPRRAVEDVGGFDPAFGRIGWGMEDTHLGAALIAAGCRVVPLRQLVSYHLDPPEAAEQWRTKLATWPATLAHYRAQLQAPAPTGRRAEFRATTGRLLATAEVIHR